MSLAGGWLSSFCPVVSQFTISGVEKDIGYALRIVFGREHFFASSDLKDPQFFIAINGGDQSAVFAKRIICDELCGVSGC